MSGSNACRHLVKKSERMVKVSSCLVLVDDGGASKHNVSRRRMKAAHMIGGGVCSKQSKYESSPTKRAMVAMLRLGFVVTTMVKSIIPL